MWGTFSGPLGCPPLRSPAAPGWPACRLRSSMALHFGIPPECPCLPAIVVGSQSRAARGAIPAPEYSYTGGSPGSATVPCCPPVHHSAVFLLHVRGSPRVVLYAGWVSRQRWHFSPHEHPVVFRRLSLSPHPFARRPTNSASPSLPPAAGSRPLGNCKSSGSTDPLALETD